MVDGEVEEAGECVDTSVGDDWSWADGRRDADARRERGEDAVRKRDEDELDDVEVGPEETKGGGG